MRIGVKGTCQKLGIILENKVILKLTAAKNVNNKKCAPKLIFINEKNVEKVLEDFWRRKLALNVKLRHFSTTPHYTNSQNSIISFGYVDF